MHTVTIVLFALLAAVGYWVLQHAAKEKEAEVYIKRTGQVVGWALLLISLLGVAFSVAAPRGRFGGCGYRMENRGGQPGNMGPGAMMGQPGHNCPMSGQPGMQQGGQPQAMRPGGDRQEGPAMRGDRPGSDENAGRDQKAAGAKPEAPKKN